MSTEGLRRAQSFKDTQPPESYSADESSSWLEA